jgi:hypothetical protein
MAHHSFHGVGIACADLIEFARAVNDREDRATGGKVFYQTNGTAGNKIVIENFLTHYTNPDVIAAIYANDA